MFEQQVGETVAKDVEAGKHKLRFVGASFIDNSFPGEGSKNALSAMGAALNVSPEAFMEFKSALFSTNFHPSESEDKFAKDSYLLEIADTVPALKSNEQFKKDVEDGTFDAWALKMSETFNKSGVEGTPTLKMDGKKVTGADGQGTPMTAADFTAAIDKASQGLTHPCAWKGPLHRSGPFRV